MSIPAILLLLPSYSAGVHIFTGTFSTEQNTKETPIEEFVSQCLVQTDVKKKKKIINPGEVLIFLNIKFSEIMFHDQLFPTILRHF